MAYTTTFGNSRAKTAAIMSGRNIGHPGPKNTGHSPSKAVTKAVGAVKSGRHMQNNKSMSGGKGSSMNPFRGAIMSGRNMMDGGVAGHGPSKIAERQKTGAPRTI